MTEFFSKRNQVYPVLHRGRAAVRKCFSLEEDWARERRLYARLGQALPLPRVLDCAPEVLVLEYLPFPHLLSVLEEQGRTGFCPAPWEALGRWLRQCHRLCGQLPADGNLRNFLWDAETRQVFGLDLEGYAPQPLEAGAASLLAHLLEYSLEDPSVQQRAAGCLAGQLNVEPSCAARARSSLRARRHSAPPPMTGILLAGGRSSRMGRDKAGLLLEGSSLLDCQVRKLRRLGCREILISGQPGLAPPGLCAVPDRYPGCGPLGGLHAGLSAASCSKCLILAVDIPLAPVQTLYQLSRAHTSGVTLLTHGQRWEPLIAVYDRALGERIPALLSNGGAPVRQLLAQTRTAPFRYLGPEEFLENCNTPQAYEKICALAEEYRQKGVPLV